MGEAQSVRAVQRVQALSAYLAQLLAVVDGLPAASGAAAGTGHDLHKIIGDLAPSEGFDELSGVAQAMGHGHLKLRLSQHELRFLPAVHAADRAEGVRIGIGPGHQIISAPKGRLHDAARGPEDDASACADAQRHVKGFFRKFRGNDVLCPKQPIYLAGRQNHIYVLSGMGVAHDRERAFLLFGDAGHQGDAENPVRIHVQKGGVIALGHRSEHLLRGLRCGKLSNHVRILGFQEAHPARTAGGKHGEGFLILVFQLLQELASLLHNGEIRAEVCVKDIGKADPPKRRHQPLRRGELPAEAELFAPGRPHRGRHLHHRNLLRIRQGVQHLIHIIPFPERSHRAVGHALAAEGAVRLFDPPVAGHIHRRAGAGARHIPDI